MPAQSASFAVLSFTAATTDELHIEAADCSRLLEVLALVPDPRKRHGVRHSMAAVLAIAAAAVLAGCRSVLAMGEWAAEAPQVVLVALGARYHSVTGRFRAPHVDTLRRVLRPVDAEAVDRAIGLFLAERVGIGAAEFPPAESGDSGPEQARPATPSRPRQPARARARHTMCDRGHGRQERRTIQVLPAPAGIFPYAQQAFLIERYVYDLNGTPTSAIAALGTTALSADQAGPERLAHLVRGRWGIEALHHICDLTYDEDRSQFRTGSAPTSSPASATWQ